MFRMSFICALAVVLFACGSKQSSPPGDAGLEATITALANQMAANASALDAQANVRFIPKTNKVVYVSDGTPITGNEYAKELGTSYATRSRLSFHWDRLEITRIGTRAAAVTGWASTAVTPVGGPTVKQRYIFTMVFAEDASGWKRILAQKSLLKDE